jgi:ABC-type glycerol-3-phosphate transport system substrate-binding protein
MRHSIRTGLLLSAAAVLTVVTEAAAQDPVSFFVVDYEAPGMGEWWQLLVKTHEEATGSPITVRSVPASQYYERLLLDAASGTAADVLTVNPNNLGELIAAGALMPLDDMIEEQGLRDRMREGGWESLTVDGTTYALPITGRTLQLIYNACHFEEAGVEGPPTTPEEFRDAAERLTVADDSGRVTRYGANMVNANEDPTYEMLLMWAIAHGGSFSDGEGNFTVDSQPVIDGLNFMKEVYDSGAVPRGMTETDLRALFATGGSAMTIDGQWQFPFIEANNPDNFDCFQAAPHPWEGQATGGVNMALAVNTDAADPQAAFELLVTAASPEMQAQFSDFSPYIPYGVNALTDEQLAARPYLEPYAQSLAEAHPIFIPGHEDQFNEVWPIIVDAVLLTLRDDVPAEETLSDAQSRLVQCCAQ